MIFDKNNTGTEEVKQIATWTSDHNYQHISKALILAKRKVLNITGKDIYKTALTHYLSNDYQLEAPTPEQANLDKLVFWFQTVLVNFAYSKNLYKDTVIWDNSGINVIWSEQYRPAQEETLKNVSNSLEQDGYEFLDLLIEFLFEKKGQFSEFQTSISGRKLKELFINDANEFNFYFNIKNSVSYFFEILDVIRRMQRTYISDAIGLELYNEATTYQLNRLDIEKSEITVTFVEELPSSPDKNTIALVNSENAYYKYTSESWNILCFNAEELLQLVKPTLVDLTIQNKLLSDISNLNATKPKQIELLRANHADSVKKSNTGLAKLTQFKENFETEEPTKPVEQDNEISDISVTDNSIMF